MSYYTIFKDKAGSKKQSGRSGSSSNTVNNDICKTTTSCDEKDVPKKDKRIELR